jgi:flagellar biosynthesis/type III secretory pathway protein FliH
VSYIALVNDKTYTLSTSNKVINANDIEILADVAAAGEHVQSLLSTVQQRVEEQSQQGYDEGYAKGMAEAQKSIDQTVSQELVRLHQRYIRERQQMADNAIVLAGQMVKRIAGELGDEAVIAAVAKTAAEEFVAAGQAKKLFIRVPMGCVAIVKEKLQTSALINASELNQWVETVADESLQGTQCLIETEMGSCNAGLDEQLDVLTQQLSDLLLEQHHG